MVGWVFDPLEECNIHLYSDANFGAHEGKSTTGIHLSVEGPNSSFPIAATSWKQTCTSHSTPEAEIVAAEHALIKVGIPGMELWETINSGVQASDPTEYLPRVLSKYALECRDLYNNDKRVSQENPCADKHARNSP